MTQQCAAFAWMIFFTGLAVAPRVAAQDLSPWLGTWFKVSGEVAGVEYGPTRTRRAAGRVGGWIYVEGFDAGAERLDAGLYFKDDLSGWRRRVARLQVFAGSVADVVCSSNDVAGEETLALLLRFAGAASGLTIERGSVRTINGSLLQSEIVDGQREQLAAQISFAGKRVDEARVPDAVRALVP